MKNIALLIHLVFFGVWLGCVLTEALFERALLGQGRVQERILVGLHKRVDLWIEIPAFSGVLISGLVLLSRSDWSPTLQMKVLFGLVAIVANIYCVGLVFRRAKAADSGDWARFEVLDHSQHKWGAVVLVGLLLALGLGVSLLVG
jgi:hypothetical protein